MVNLNVKQGVYCKNCIWRWHSFLNNDNGQCSHIDFRKKHEWDHKQLKEDLYPFCTHINTNGYCRNFSKKKWRRKIC